MIKFDCNLFLYHQLDTDEWFVCDIYCKAYSYGKTAQEAVDNAVKIGINPDVIDGLEKVKQ